MKDLISIIIPVYNASNYLEKCLKCVINQTYKKIEIILIDDGSTDNSGEICDDFSNIDKRISVLHTKNKGQSSARNLGLKKAKGKYISFIDADDYVENDFIEYLYKNLIEQNVDISACGFSMVYDDGTVVNKNKKNIKMKMNRKESLKYLIINGYISDSPCNKLFKKALFTDILFPVNKVYEDRRILPILFNKCNLVYYDSTVKYFYMQHQNSTTHNYNKIYQMIEATVERKKFIDNFYPELKKYTSQDLILAYLIVSNVLILKNDTNKYYNLHSELKYTIKNEKYTYRKLQFIKKIQAFIYIKFPKLYLKIFYYLKKR